MKRWRGEKLRQRGETELLIAQERDWGLSISVEGGIDGISIYHTLSTVCRESHQSHLITVFFYIFFVFLKFLIQMAEISYSA